MPQDKKKAANMFEKGCNGGDAEACKIMSAIYANGEGRPKDKEKAGKLAQRACMLGHTSSCAKGGQ